MKNINIKTLPIVLLVLLFAMTAAAQNVYKLNGKSSKLSVAGTSSLHDWEMEASGFTAETSLKLDGKAVSEIQYIKFSTPVSGLKNGNSTMDKKAHEALQEKKFPQIKFALKGGSDPDLSGQSLKLSGLLTIAGKTKEVNLPVDFSISSDQKFTASGTMKLKMSDFEIDPPTAFFGTLKTGNEVELKFDFEFSKVN